MNGCRVYMDAEVQRLWLLAELVRLGHSIGQIAPLEDEELVALVNQARAAGASTSQLRATSETRQDLEELMRSVDSFDLAKVKQALVKIRYTTSARNFAFDLIPQIMFLIGKRIEEKKISISQEHALSELIQVHTRQIYEDLTPLESLRSPRQPLIFCTREGDPHDFGLLMAAIACRHAGFTTHYIGKNLPTRSLGEAVQKLKPVAVVLGVAALPPEDEKIRPADYLRQVDALLPPKVEIWVGGTGARDLPRLNQGRDMWIFESIVDLENKLALQGGTAAKKG